MITRIFTSLGIAAAIFVLKAETSIASPQCLEEVIFCQETFEGFETQDCVTHCYITHNCGTGPSYSYRIEVDRRNCSHLIAGTAPSDDYPYGATEINKGIYLEEIFSPKSDR